MERQVSSEVSRMAGDRRLGVYAWRSVGGVLARRHWLLFAPGDWVTGTGEWFFFFFFCSFMALAP